MFAQLTRNAGLSQRPPFDYVVVDEAQDVSVAQLRFLAAVCGQRPNGLFFSGDLGQRIFQQPFSWKELGVDVRGRSQTLRINYRTSHQIRSQADRLLDPRFPTSTATWKNGRGLSRCSTGQAGHLGLREQRRGGYRYRQLVEVQDLRRCGTRRDRRVCTFHRPTA